MTTPLPHFLKCEKNNKRCGNYVNGGNGIGGAGKKTPQNR